MLQALPCSLLWGLFDAEFVFGLERGGQPECLPEENCYCCSVMTAFGLRGYLKIKYFENWEQNNCYVIHLLRSKSCFPPGRGLHLFFFFIFIFLLDLCVLLAPLELAL